MTHCERCIIGEIGVADLPTHTCKPIPLCKTCNDTKQVGVSYETDYGTEWEGRECPDCCDLEDT